MGRLRSLLARSNTLRLVRARLPYRMKNWRRRTLKYWQFECDAEGELLNNVCGPDQTSEMIDLRRDSIVWSLNPQSDDVCLDVGCGVGRVEKHLAPLVKEVHGVDFSNTMLSLARKRLAGCDNVSFYRNDGESLSMFADEVFDLAWAELTFHHVPIEITKGYLTEIARVLKPTGRFVCQLPLRSFYRLHSRSICGWLTTPEAERLMEQHFQDVEVSDDGRHILAFGRSPIRAAQHKQPSRPLVANASYR